MARTNENATGWELHSGGVQCGERRGLRSSWPATGTLPGKTTRLEDSLANTYPYISAQASLVKAIEQFRRSFPATVDSGLLKRLKIAPGNESYLINILRFLGLIDESGAKVDDAANAFYGSEEHFKSGFTDLVAKAYGPIFTELGDDAWNASREDLSHWFRMVDKTTDLIGGRQASTFLTLAGITGKGAPLEAKAPAKTPVKSPPKRSSAKDADATIGVATKEPDVGGGGDSGGQSNGRGQVPDVNPVGLSVRIEVNVPVGATAEEYDAMFASIRKHLYPA